MSDFWVREIKSATASRDASKLATLGQMLIMEEEENEELTLGCFAMSHWAELINAADMQREYLAAGLFVAGSPDVDVGRAHLAASFLESKGEVGAEAARRLRGVVSER